MKIYDKREYQSEAITMCLAALYERGRESVLLISPVGSGKTYMALEIVHRFQEAIGRNITVNWVAPRLKLLDQMMQANKELYSDNIRPVSLFNPNPPQADFVVLDEAHHEATRSCLALYEKMGNKWTLGLSATPQRTDKMHLSFQETIRTLSISRLVREGFLSKWKSFAIPKYTPEIVANHYIADRERWGKSLAFFRTIAECEVFREKVSQYGIRCEVVTSTSDKDRQLDLYEQGEIDVIANVSMLTEGFDQPDVKTIFVRDASRLPTIQMCGRGLRLFPGKIACNIVQSVNTYYSFARTCLPAEAYRYDGGRWNLISGTTAEIEKTIQETLRRMDMIGKEIKTLKELPRTSHQAQVMAKRAEQARLRHEEQVKKLRAYYSEHKLLYKLLAEIVDHISSLPYEHKLPKCYVHIISGKVDHLFATLMAKPNVIVFFPNNWPIKNAKDIALSLVTACIRLGRSNAGLKTEYSDSAEELFRLGYSLGCQITTIGSHMDRVFKLIEKHLPMLLNMFKPLKQAKIKPTIEQDKNEQEWRSNA